MRTTYFRKQILLVAIVGMGSWGCTVMSSDADGGGGAMTCSPSTACMGMTPSPPAAPPAGTALGPCDIYAADGGPCVAAHSTVRALYCDVQRRPSTRSGRQTARRMTSCPSPRAASPTAADQDDFCGVDGVHDLDHLRPVRLGKPPHQGAGGHGQDDARQRGQREVRPAHARRPEGVRRPHRARDWLPQQRGLRHRDLRRTPRPSTWSSPATSSTAAAASTTGTWSATAATTARARWRPSTSESAPSGTRATGNGPWVMGDLENGLWAGDSSPYADNPPIPTWKYVTGMVKGEPIDRSRTGTGPSRRAMPRRPQSPVVRRDSARAPDTTRCGKRAPSVSGLAATTATPHKGTGSKAS